MALELYFISISPPRALLAGKVVEYVFNKMHTYTFKKEKRELFLFCIMWYKRASFVLVAHCIPI